MARSFSLRASRPSSWGGTTAKSACPGKNASAPVWARTSRTVRPRSARRAPSRSRADRLDESAEGPSKNTRSGKRDRASRSQVRRRVEDDRGGPHHQQMWGDARRGSAQPGPGAPHAAGGAAGAPARLQLATVVLAVEDPQPRPLGLGLGGGQLPVLGVEVRGQGRGDVALAAGDGGGQLELDGDLARRVRRRRAARHQEGRQDQRQTRAQGLPQRRPPRRRPDRRPQHRGPDRRPPHRGPDRQPPARCPKGRCASSIEGASRHGIPVSR